MAYRVQVFPALSGEGYHPSDHGIPYKRSLGRASANRIYFRARGGVSRIGISTLGSADDDGHS
jgi:hypothetical protein